MKKSQCPRRALSLGREQPWSHTRRRSPSRRGSSDSFSSARRRPAHRVPGLPRRRGSSTCTLALARPRFRADVRRALAVQSRVRRCRYAPSTAGQPPSGRLGGRRRDRRGGRVASQRVEPPTGSASTHRARALDGAVAKPHAQDAGKQYRGPSPGKVAAVEAEHTQRLRPPLAQVGELGLPRRLRREYKRDEAALSWRICTQLRAINAKLQCAQAQKGHRRNVVPRISPPPEVVDSPCTSVQDGLTRPPSWERAPAT